MLNSKRIAFDGMVAIMIMMKLLRLSKQCEKIHNRIWSEKGEQIGMYSRTVIL